MPAALCGIVGIKATYGRVSRRGVFPLSWSLDHAGPLTKSVSDAATVLSVIAGYDPLDPTSSREPVADYTAVLQPSGDRPLAGLRIGYCQTYFFENLDPEVERLVHKALAVLAQLGAEVHEVKIPYLDQMVQIQTLLSGPEMYTAHSENVEVRAEDYGANILPRLYMSKDIPASAYLEAQRLRQAYQSVWVSVYQGIDLLVAPTTGIPAFPIGAKTIHLNGKDVNPRDLGILGRTSPSNFNGYPAISVPCGYTDAGLPVGLQIQGVPFDESLVFRAAFAYEQATSWFTKRVPKVPARSNGYVLRDMKLDVKELNPELQDLSTVLEILGELGKNLPLETEPATFFTPTKVTAKHRKQN